MTQRFGGNPAAFETLIRLRQAKKLFESSTPSVFALSIRTHIAREPQPSGLGLTYRKMSSSLAQMNSSPPSIDLSDVRLPARLSRLDNVSFANTLSSILHQYARASQHLRFRELEKYAPAIDTVIRSRCTEPRAASIVNAVLEQPTTTKTHDVYLKHTVLDPLLSQLPEESLSHFRASLLRLASYDPQAYTRSNISIVRLSATAADIIRFIDKPHAAWAPSRKGDVMAIRSLKERVHSPEEMRPHVPELLTWLADVNWPHWRGCRKQLARFPEETIDPIRDCFQTVDNDPEWLERMLDFVSEFVPRGELWERMRGEVERQVEVQTKKGGEDEESFVEAAREWLMRLDEAKV